MPDLPGRARALAATLTAAAKSAGEVADQAELSAAAHQEDLAGRDTRIAELEARLADCGEPDDLESAVNPIRVNAGSVS